MVKVFIDVKGCKDCPYRRTSYGQGGSMSFCKHPIAPDGYSSVISEGYIDNPERHPLWCPIMAEAQN